MDIISTFGSIYESFMNLLKPYPAVQASLLAFIGMGITGAVGFVLVKAPNRIVMWFKRQFMTTLTFNTSGTGWGQYNQQQYIAFMNWYSKTWWYRHCSRIISFDSGSSKAAIGPGPGNHFFMFRFRPCWCVITEITESNSERTKYRVAVNMLGRNRKSLTALMDAFMEKEDEDGRYVFDDRGGEWNWITTLIKRPKESVILNPELDKRLFGEIEFFINNRDWYIKRGIPHKLTLLLYGPPGTGKSSLAHIIASHFDRSLYIVNVNSISPSLPSLFQKARGGIVLLEDIDSADIAKSRVAAPTNVIDETARVNVSGTHVLREVKANPLALTPKSNSFELPETFGLSGLLNSLQGVVPLDNLIVIMTTNHPEKLDPALIRDSRVDSRYLINYLQTPEIQRYITMLYPDYKLDMSIEFPDIPGATLHKHFMSNRDNPDGFVTAVLNDKLYKDRPDIKPF